MMSSSVFSLFGEVVESTIATPAKMDLTASPSTVVWQLVDSDPLYGVWQDASPLVTSDEQIGEQPALRVYKHEDTWVFSETGVANFFVSPTSILVHVADERFAHAVEIRLLGQIASVRAHLRNRLALHSAVVEIDGLCLGLLAGNGGGKTSLTATMLSMGGSLVADDLLVVSPEGIAESGYPQMRMWVPEAEFFHGNAQDLALVHPDLDKRRVPIGDGYGRFRSGPIKVDALAFLVRHDDAPCVERLDAIHSHTAVVGQLFLHGLLSSLGFAQSAFSLCGELTEHVPCFAFKSPHVTPQELPGLCSLLIDGVRSELL